MSGTPIADDVYNLSAMFNMLRGYMRIGKEKFTAFPSDYSYFYRLFVNEEKGEMKNKQVFAERIIGLVSYYHGLYDTGTDLFPSMKSNIVYCDMSPYQTDDEIKNNMIIEMVPRRDNTQGWVTLNK